MSFADFVLQKVRNDFKASLYVAMVLGLYLLDNKYLLNLWILSIPSVFGIVDSISGNLKCNRLASVSGRCQYLLDALHRASSKVLIRAISNAFLSKLMAILGLPLWRTVLALKFILLGEILIQIYKY